MSVCTARSCCCPSAPAPLGFKRLNQVKHGGKVPIPTAYTAGTGRSANSQSGGSSQYRSRASFHSQREHYSERVPENDDYPSVRSDEEMSRKINPLPGMYMRETNAHYKDVTPYNPASPFAGFQQKTPNSRGSAYTPSETNASGARFSYNEATVPPKFSKQHSGDSTNSSGDAYVDVHGGDPLDGSAPVANSTDHAPSAPQQQQQVPAMPAKQSSVPLQQQQPQQPVNDIPPAASPASSSSHASSSAYVSGAASAAAASKNQSQYSPKASPKQSPKPVNKAGSLAVPASPKQSPKQVSKKNDAPVEEIGEEPSKSKGY